ncbi:SDR family oxidoreductase [Falsibacillus albus]|uniref:SDR family oxidoreductase n=1 Tax=Falsibacillus albus TaxID=2478915 RepID=A0A3L7K4T4_9BACI|nr:SDR family oxidoreductase [Falsibacillus albus]RLQ97081.1 SDR family oxidoreductase [Falsibacillus albus]
MELNLKGKNALVAASSQGLGKAIAEALLREGANVILTSRNEEKLAQAAADLSGLDGRVAYFPCDITKYEQIKSLVQWAGKKSGSIDILINNSGGPPAGKFDELSDDEWQYAFELNLLSYVRMIREVLPLMKDAGGSIINIASSSIKEPIPGLILSNTFRTGIAGLTKTLAQELAPYNILINTVAPGRIDTDRVKHLDDLNAEKIGMHIDQFKERMKSNIPLGRYGTPDEFAKVIVFLASSSNTYMTGSTFMVDGGMVKSI